MSLASNNFFFNFIVKCYVQQCQSDDSGVGYRCYYGADGEGDIKGEVTEDDIGCYEMRGTRDGKLFEYHRNIVQREGYVNSDRKHIKEGCVTTKDDRFGMAEEFVTCYCFKDFCNTKYETPDGAKHGWGNEE